MPTKKKKALTLAEAISQHALAVNHLACAEDARAKSLDRLPGKLAKILDEKLEMFREAVTGPTGRSPDDPKAAKPCSKCGLAASTHEIVDNAVWKIDELCGGEPS